MKFIYSEGSADYSKYYFPYQVFALKEPDDDISEMYTKGFLPVRSIHNLYYLTRSCRVNLKIFQASSENRRILRKAAGLKLSIKPLNNFNLNLSDNRNIIRDFNKRKNLSKHFTAYGIQKIFSIYGNYNCVAEFKVGDSNVGLVAMFQNDEIFHYAHPFYSDIKLGMLMMTKLVEYAKLNEKKYIYLGTCYESKSLYKMQFEGFEFFDGISWSDNLVKLNYLVLRDGKAYQNHLFQDEEYLSKFYKESKLGRLVKKLQNEKK